MQHYWRDDEMAPSAASVSSDGGGGHSPMVTDHLSTRPPPKRKAGRKKFQETRHPVYKGVRRRNDKWVCAIRHPQKTKSRIWLGTFVCPEMAAKAHDVAALALCRADTSSFTATGTGRLMLNFPDSAHLLPRATSDSIKDIRCAVLQLADVGASSGRRTGRSCDGDYVAEGADDLATLVTVVEPMVFVDEEELFNMPALLNGMAEGLLVTPPAMKRGFCWNDDLDGGDHGMDFTLWSDD